MTGGEESDAADPGDLARRRVEREHADLLADLAAAADDVAETWEGGVVADSTALSTALGATLRERGIHARLPAVLADAVAATDQGLRADPVAAPPYVAVTSLGPVLRGTLPDGRLVLTLRVFAVERDPQVHYVRDPPGAVSVEVAFRGHG